LPKPYEELQKKDISLPRNPLITKMFRIIDLAENAGYGFDKMFNGWLSYYKQKPVVSGDIDNYKIEFYFADAMSENIAKVPRKGSIFTSEESITGSQKSSQKILVLLKNNSQITIEELAIKIGISDRAVKKHLSNLKKLRLIRRIGPDKGGYWQIIKRDE
jgi:ATP-dependent DNA helicase RecG